MMVIHENFFGEDNEIIYKGIISCATVTLELSTLKFIGMHFVFVETYRIKGIVELVKKGLAAREIKKLYLALVPTNWKGPSMKLLESLRTSFPAGEYLINELSTYGNGHDLCFKFDKGSVVITDKGSNITDEFEEWECY